MTDYKNLKLIASSSPHIRSKDNTRSIMLDVIIALLPALVMSIYVFGVRALTMVLVSVAACVFWEWAYRKLLKKPQSIGDLSAVVTGILLAFVSATLMDRFLTINRAFYPLMVITQTVPTIAIAPVLVLWMGFGMAPKVALVVITTFFPIAIGLLDGYKSVDPDAVNLMRAMGATKFQIFRHLKFPSALNQFFSGLKISASYAVVGAVVAEWLGGFNGLGVYMTRVKKAYSFDKMFAVIIFIVIISLLLMLAVNIIRNLSMPWIRTEKEGNET